MFFYLTDSLSEIYSHIPCISLGVNFTFCVQFTGEVTSVVVEINMTGLYQTMIGRLRQLSEPRLRQQAGIEKSQTPLERDILVQWVRNQCLRKPESSLITLRCCYNFPARTGDQRQCHFKCHFCPLFQRRIVFKLLKGFPPIIKIL